jgi:hypothetical protein
VWRGPNPSPVLYRRTFCRKLLSLDVTLLDWYTVYVVPMGLASMFKVEELPAIKTDMMARYARLRGVISQKIIIS